jgi:hypothetical protein
MEQLIFEFASLSSCPTNCTDFFAQFDQHPNRNSSLLEQVQDNCRYRYKSECAGALAGGALAGGALAGVEALAPC